MKPNKKIIDCFTFFGELDLLELRFRYLSDVVDYFVIVESDKTFSGKDKSFVFKDNMERYADFQKKIIYVPLRMKTFKPSKRVAWKRERFQRNAIKEGLKKIDIQDDDLVLLSDVDEIPNKKVLQKLKSSIQNLDIHYNINPRSILKILFLCLVRKKVPSKYFLNVFLGKYPISINFRMTLHYYYCNYKKFDTIWNGTQCIEAKALKTLDLEALRTLRKHSLKSIDFAGWHFSYLGGIEMIKQKIKSYSHQEYNTPEATSDENIRFCINNGYIFQNHYKDPSVPPTFKVQEMSVFPKDLQKEISLFNHFIFKKELNKKEL